MGRFTAAGERGTFAFRVGRPRLLETDYRSTFNSGCMTPTSEQVQLTSETDIGRRSDQLVGVLIDSVVSNPSLIADSETKGFRWTKT